MTKSSGTRAARRAQTEERILASARRLFSRQGFQQATIRAVAADADVDPALVIQYFGSKRELFSTALSAAGEDSVGGDPNDALEVLLASLKDKLGELPEATNVMMRSMLTHPDATEATRQSLDRQITAVGEAITFSDARLRAALVMSSIVGVTVARELLAVDDLQHAAPEEIIDLMRLSLGTLFNQQP